MLDCYVAILFIAFTLIQQFILIFKITGKEACALSKDEFLARAPNFMGDILWAHLEMLQKEVEREKILLQNIPTGFSDPITNDSNFMGSRTYTQLDSTTASTTVSSTNGTQQPSLPPLIPSTSAAFALAAQQANISSKNSYTLQNSINTSMPLQYNNQTQRHSCSTTSVTSSLIHNPIASSTTPSESWNHTGSNAGSVADGSEYSYHGGNTNMNSIANNGVELKYSHQMAVAASRVPQLHPNGYTMPQYPPYPDYENNLWGNPHVSQHNSYPTHQSQQPILNDPNNSQIHQSPNQWHQPTSTSSEFHSITSGKPVSPVSSATISPPLGLNALSSTSIPNHLHPASGQQIVPGAGIHQHPAFLQVIID